MQSIIFNGKDSYKEIGLSITNRPPIPVFTQKIEEVNIKGGEAVTYTASSNTENEGYNTYVYKIDVAIHNETNIKNAMRKLKGFFKLNTNNNTIALNDDKDYFYKIINIGFEEAINGIEPIVETTINFLIRPFEYAITGKNKISITNNYNYNYEGTIFTRPLLTIVATGTVQITINNNTFEVRDIVDTVTIDSMLYETYSNTVSYNNKTIGNYPILTPGNNIISFTGNVTKIEMTPNTRYL